MIETNTSIATDKRDASAFDVRAVFLRLLRYLFRHGHLLALAVGFMVLTGLIEASVAAFIEKVLKNGFLTGDQWFVKWSGIMLMVVVFARAIFGFIANYTMAKVGRLVIYEIRQDIFYNLLRLPTRYFDQNSSAKNVSKLIYDVETTAVATTDTLSILFKDSVVTIGLVSWLFYKDWRLTLIFLLTIPFLIGIIRYANKRFRRTSKEIQDSMGGIADTVKEASIGHKVIKVYGGQEQEFENFTNANRFNLQQNLKRAKVSAGIVPSTLLLVGPILALILYIFLNYLREGPESAAAFVSYIMACLMLMSPLKRLAKVNEKIQIGVTAANSVFSVIDAEPEQNTGTVDYSETQGHLRFDDVSFCYAQDDDQPVLQNIDFEIKPGERVALVGPSGSGKSTITSLILRFYRPQSGVIRLDGHDLNDLVLGDLRDQVSLVSQETSLFDDTIGRNIMYGMLDTYDEARLNAAIKAAHVDEFLHELPLGLETVVGEHGLRLSGGQRQRIAIARAIYKDSPILILDEATSALDNKSERYVQDALEALMKGRTSLVIAHRLSTIESADNIVVLDHGRIVEQGPHKKLLRQGGVYADLHRAQSKNPGKKGFFFWNR
ncbi:lipid A export permease/ATP-binding protein MsbA [Arenicella xantha]|uniref:Subfamily B ATP-binding cassette protein MsbA n=1 Tax=Arenicella xantha TaxID=644221 RepID=A0A395JJG7_9GAMM|nr:lipid A export permease/ATP-binding protein MsbA [Arenicella xantha]RBP50831.1 subfamily B ATP-binding cassette protein MsbA [Arenicella xantha]